MTTTSATGWGACAPEATGRSSTAGPRSNFTWARWALETLLIDCARDNDVERLRTLLMSGVAFDQMEKGAFRAIDAAALMGHMTIVKLLTEAGADMKARNMLGRTVLHHATDGGHGVELVRWLLDHGTEANARDHAGVTPLHFCAQWPQPEALELLIAQGADVNAKDAKVLTPLDYAIRADCASAQEILRRRGP